MQLHQPADANEIATIDALFGAGPGTPPTVTITSPHPGDNVQAGFSISVSSVDNGPQPMNKVELRIDGALVDTQTTGSPNNFTAPSTLGQGLHTIEATAYDAQLTPGKSSIQVMMGPPCTKDSECTTTGDVCIGGRCVAGPSLAGGLGMPCTGNTDARADVRHGRHDQLLRRAVHDGPVPERLQLSARERHHRCVLAGRQRRRRWWWRLRGRAGRCDQLGLLFGCSCSRGAGVADSFPW